MYYVLFTYSKGQKERDFRGFRFDDDVITFLHKNYEKIDIVQIIAAEKSFRLGLVETEELIKSELISQDIETDLSDPEKESKFLRSRRHAYLKNKEKESSAMEKIGDDIEKEIEEDKNIGVGPSAGKALSDEEIIQKNKEALEKADRAIAAAKAEQEKRGKFIPKPAEKPEKKTQMRRIIDKTNWPICPDCKKNKMAPWNTSGRCSACQQYKKIPKKK